MPRFIIQEGGKKRVYEICEDQVSIGTGPQNNIKLKDPKVSADHCTVKRTSRGFKLVDMETKQGTKVNSKFINQHTLKNGDKIRLGNTLIVYQDRKAKVIDIDDEYTKSAIRRSKKEEEKFPPWAVGVLIACGALVIVLIIVIVSQTTEERSRMHPAEKLLVDAKAAFFEEEDTEKAEKLYKEYERIARREELPEGVVAFAKEVKAEFEKGLVNEEEYGLNTQANNELLQFESWCFQHPYKIEEAMKRADDFIEKYKDSETIEKVQHFRRIIDPKTYEGKKVAEIEALCDDFTQTYIDSMFNYMVNEVRQKYSVGGLDAKMSPDEAYLAVMEKVGYKLDRLRYGDALKYCDEFINDFPDSEKVEVVKKRKDWIREMAKQKFEEIQEWCRDWESQKKYRTAYGSWRDKVEMRFGIPEYVEKARKERLRLEALHTEQVKKKIEARKKAEGGGGE